MHVDQQDYDDDCEDSGGVGDDVDNDAADNGVGDEEEEEEDHDDIL